MNTAYRVDGIVESATNRLFEAAFPEYDNLVEEFIHRAENAFDIAISESMNAGIERHLKSDEVTDISDLEETRLAEIIHDSWPDDMTEEQFQKFEASVLNQEVAA